MPSGQAIVKAPACIYRRWIGLTTPPTPLERGLCTLGCGRAPPHRIKFGFHHPEEAIYHQKTSRLTANNHASPANPMTEANKRYVSHFDRFNDD
jgi:hypothetical protein